MARGDEPAARALLERIARTDTGAESDGDSWLAVHVEPGRAADVNRALAEAGVFASGLESGTDLEMLFLQLTGGTAASNEGTFGTAGVVPGADVGGSA